MKIIFSRKGFDSSYGRVPSPIFDDGSFYSLPIPLAQGVPLNGHQGRGCTLPQVVSDLTRGRVTRQSQVHIDPDLDPEALNRLPGWRPAFGQVDAAQGHLRKQRVSEGDLFLFFGWFRAVRQLNGRWTYVNNASDLHVLFGWLQIGSIVNFDQSGALVQKAYPWLQSHPHVQHARTFVNRQNTIYIANDRLQLPGLKRPLQGGGLFPKWNESLQLTASGRSRSIWKVPTWMDPAGRSSCLTYHANKQRWMKNDPGSGLLLQTVGKGQEFVLSADDFPEAVPWAARLIALQAR